MRGHQSLCYFHPQQNLLPSVMSPVFLGIVPLLSQFGIPQGKGDGVPCAGYLLGSDFKMNMFGNNEEAEMDADGKPSCTSA